MSSDLILKATDYFFKNISLTSGFSYPSMSFVDHGWFVEWTTYASLFDLIIFGAPLTIALLLVILIQKSKQQYKIFSPTIGLFIFLILFLSLDQVLKTPVFGSLLTPTATSRLMPMAELIKAVTAMISLITVFALTRDVIKILQIRGDVAARTYCGSIVQSTSNCTITKELTPKKELEDQLTAKAVLLADKAQLLSQKNKKLNKLNKDLKIKNEEINALAYAASHDLKSPLRIITNFSHLVYERSQEILDQESLKLIKTIQTQGLQMGVLINDLSAYLPLGSEDYVYQDVDCGQIIINIVNTLNKPKEFQIDIDCALPLIYAPRIPLQIVLQNLIVNAVTHHQCDQGHVEITAEQIQDKVIFRVKDDGLGIAAIYHEKIFDMFQTLKPREETGASGIGLSLVRRVLQRYGGTIKLYSREGQGSMFEVIWQIMPKDKR